MNLVSMEIPGGLVHAIVDSAGAVVACGYDLDALVGRLGLGVAGLVRAGDDDRVGRALRAYASGELTALDDLPVCQPGTEFRQRVWRELRAVEPGHPIGYAELASRAGRPAAVRAAASACASNLVAVIVPCHRIVRSDGTLGGYLYGLDAKRALLAHEAPPTARLVLRSGPTRA